MKQCFVTFRSVTYAQRGRDVLEKGGISTTLARTTGRLQEKGCGYHLRIPEHRLADAVTLLTRHRVIYSKIYCRNPDGTMEEKT